MVRLPSPGSDSGQWGHLLNNYLLQIHEADGKLKANVVERENLAPGAVSKGDVGLADVNNTSDANKPISNDQQAALNQKLTTADLDSQTATIIASDATATAQALANAFVQFTDLDGNPLPSSTKVLIKVDTSTGRVEDIVVEGGDS